VERDVRAGLGQESPQPLRLVRTDDRVLPTGGDKDAPAAEVRHPLRNEGHHRTEEDRTRQHLRTEEEHGGADVGPVGEASGENAIRGEVVPLDRGFHEGGKFVRPGAQVVEMEWK
jgi:hypothetical protein